jgi:hypothetical protein
MSEPPEEVGEINVPAGGVQVRDVPLRARQYKWKPGQSGNPSGRGGLYHECRRLAAEASPYAMRKLITLMDARDERVAYMATVAVLDRAGVRPTDYDPQADLKALDALPLEERRAQLAVVVERAQALLAKPSPVQITGPRTTPGAAPSETPDPA